MKFSRNELLPDITFKTSRSGGKGGQNVNKVSSKAELNYDLENSKLFNSEQKELIANKLVNRIIGSGVIQVVTEEERSQYKNKERSIEKLIDLLQKALHRPKTRKASRPKRAAVENRLDEKKRQAMKKIGRGKGFLNE